MSAMWLWTFLACLPPWHVVVSADPSPLLGAERLDLAPLRFPGLHVGEETEAEYLARKSPEQAAAWQADKRELDRAYAEAATARAAACGLRLEPPGGPGSHTVVGEVWFIEPGFYAGVVSNPSAVRLRVRVTHRGQVAEEVELVAGTSPVTASIGPVGIPTAPTVTDRLREDGTLLGETVGEYLCQRKAGR